MRAGGGGLLLAIDIGNTNTCLGVYEGARLAHQWRFGTRQDVTSDEIAVLVRGMFAGDGVTTGEVGAAALASVVPPMTRPVAEMVRAVFGVDPLVIEHGIRTGIPIRVDNPKDVGADRIVNAVAAFERCNGACIVVDFGTATTFDAISAKGEYLGGAIAPGIAIAAEALFRGASKLPRVTIEKPPNVIGHNTVESMQSGILYGYVALVEGLVARMRAEFDSPVRVLATGGLAPVIAAETSAIEEVLPFLTLDGLRLLHERNVKRVR